MTSDLLLLSNRTEPNTLVDIASIVAMSRCSLSHTKVYVSNIVSYTLPVDQANAVADMIHKDKRHTYRAIQGADTASLVRIDQIDAVVPNGNNGFDVHFKTGAVMPLAHDAGTGLLKHVQSMISRKNTWRRS